MCNKTFGGASPITTGFINLINNNQHVHYNPSLTISINPNKMAVIIKEFLKVDFLNELDESLESQLQEFNREDEHLKLKNELNGVSKEYFDSIIQYHSEHFYEIENFLKQNRNHNIRKKYASIATNLHFNYLSQCTHNRNLMNHIQTVVSEINNSIQCDDDEVEEYVMIFIHHMYFKCDYGINPK